MQHADEKNIIRPDLVEDQIAFKSRHAKTSDAGLLQIFPAASDLWMPDNPFKRGGDAILKTDGKFR